jgi:hypothetical protein
LNIVDTLYAEALNLLQLDKYGLLQKSKAGFFIRRGMPNIKPELACFSGDF